MLLNLMKAKIHRARITEANLEYEGSITIDRSLMEAAGILPYEQVHVLDCESGARFITYAIEGPAGSDVQVSAIQGGSVKAQASSGSDLDLSGTCTSLDADAASGSDLDARSLRCETVSIQASSGSDVSVSASRSVTGKATSGSDVKISGAPPTVQVDKSSGADVDVRN